MDMHELKIQMMAMRIERRQLAHDLGISYSMLSSYLGSFTRMPDRIYNQIVKVISDHNQTTASTGSR